MRIVSISKPLKFANHTGSRRTGFVSGFAALYAVQAMYQKLLQRSCLDMHADDPTEKAKKRTQTYTRDACAALLVEGQEVGDA